MTPDRLSASHAAAAEAMKAVNRAVSAAYDRRQFTVSKFGRHADGYLHARVVVDGQPLYFHCRFGSWLAPGQVGSRSVLKEPEALLGSRLGGEVKLALAERARQHERREGAA